MEISEFLFRVALGVIGFFVIVTLIKNLFFLLVAPFYPVREKWRYIRHSLRRKKAGLPAYEPLVSVIVPAWDEEVGIVKTMESIVYNGYRNTELIIINDGSEDNTEELVMNFIAKFESEKKRRPIKDIRYIYQTNAGKGVALNRGVEAATGEIVFTVDADSALRVGAIAKLTKYYLDDEIMAVVGNVEVINASTIYGLAQQLEYYFGFYNKRAHALLGAEYIFGGACASFRRSVFDTIGLFDTENKTEDIEMSMRTKVYGLKSTYAEDVICYTEGASDLRGLISQRIRWKKGRLDTFIKYRSLFFSTDERHNTALSFFILPFSILMEIQLLFEPLAVASIFAYTILTSEYLSIAIGLGFIALVFIAVSVFHANRPRPQLVLYFPFFWPLFYMLDWIEFLALYKSVALIRNKKDVTWQNWQRQGIAAPATEKRSS